MRGASGDALQHMKSWGRHCVPRKSPCPFSTKVPIIGIPGFSGVSGPESVRSPVLAISSKKWLPKKGGSRDLLGATESYRSTAASVVRASFSAQQQQTSMKSKWELKGQEKDHSSPRYKSHLSLFRMQRQSCRQSVIHRRSCDLQL